MSLFDIRPWIVKKKDGRQKQVMPQTTINGVIGLEKELTSIKAAVENLTEKKIDKNYQNNFLTKKDLENYVTTQQLTQSIATSKVYADSIVKTLKESLPTSNCVEISKGEDANNLKKQGTYHLSWGTNTSNFPENDGKTSGTLIVIGNGKNDINQLFIGVFDHQIRLRSYGGTNPTWSPWK